jgi:hypothetical protein
VSARAVGTCRDTDCGQTDLLWEDGFCAEDCRQRVTGCPVPLCGCAGRCGAAWPPPVPDGGGRA